MLKVSEYVGDTWIDRDCPATYAKETLKSGTERLTIGLPRSSTDTFRRLAEAMSEPFFVLYILHTPRGEGESGRYQSQELSRVKLDTFLKRFEDFLSGDARHDVWVRSISDGDLIVWDRHNTVFVYGDLSKFMHKLGELGFRNQQPPALADHLHHYRPEFDADAAEVLSALEWRRTPLRPEDEQ